MSVIELKYYQDYYIYELRSLLLKTVKVEQTYLEFYGFLKKINVLNRFYLQVSKANRDYAKDFCHSILKKLESLNLMILFMLNTENPTVYDYTLGDILNEVSNYLDNLSFLNLKDTSVINSLSNMESKLVELSVLPIERVGGLKIEKDGQISNEQEIMVTNQKSPEQNLAIVFQFPNHSNK